MANVLTVKNDTTGESKQFPVGFSWKFFILSPFFGFPCFINKLIGWGILWVVIVIAYWGIMISSCTMEVIATGGRNVGFTQMVGTIYNLFVVALAFYMGWAGNKMSVRKLLSMGWKVDPSSPGLEDAHRKWGIPLPEGK